MEVDLPSPTVFELDSILIQHDWQECDLFYFMPNQLILASELMLETISSLATRSLAEDRNSLICGSRTERIFILSLKMPKWRGFLLLVYWKLSFKFK